MDSGVEPRLIVVLFFSQNETSANDRFHLYMCGVLIVHIALLVFVLLYVQRSLFAL